MKFSVKKTIAVLLVVVMTAMLFTSCDVKSVFSKDTEVPQAVEAKVDLKDSNFTFTYGDLKNVLPADKLGSLFEEYEKLSDNITIDLSYNDITSRYGEDGEIYDGIMALLSEEEKATLTDNAANVLEYFVNKVNDAKAQKPITQYGEYFWTDNGSIKFSQDGNDTDKKVKTAAKFFEHFTTRGAGSTLPNGTTEKGDDLTDIIYLLGEDTACKLTPDDIVSAVSSLVYETQTVTEEYTNDQGKKDTRDVKVVTGITRVIKIVVKNDDASVLKAYSMHDKNAILDEMKKGASYFTVDDYAVDFDTCTIVATFNAVTDNIITVQYDKNMKISTQVNGVGDLEYLGKQDLEFNCTDRMEYHFGWESEAE